MARKLCVLVGVLLAAATLAGAASADGDPASDYLLGQQQFVPPDAGISSASAARLAATLSDARARGFTIRVAIIGSRYDMGSITELWKQPKIYARFLGQELRLLYHGRLLTVMPNGYGTSKNGLAVPAAQAALDRLPLPSASPDLADAAVRGVVALAAQAGVVVTPPAKVSSDAHSANEDRLTIVLAVLAALVLGGAVWWGRRLLRRRKIA